MNPAEMSQVEVADKDLPLRDDIRLLGSILGDTVRSQEGETVFGLVEGIRQTSVRFHRDEDETARRELEGMLNGLSPRQTTRIIRAFSYFSHLANIAEDLHHIRRTRAHALAGSAAARGDLGPRARPCAGGRHHARPAPHLLRRRPGQPGAHRPSHRGPAQEHAEPRDGDRTAADRARARAAHARGAGGERRGACGAPCSRCGRPASCAGPSSPSSTRSRTGSPITSPPSCASCRGSTRRSRTGWPALDPAWNDTEVPSFLRMGSWIGGDRDGNPFVTADVLRQALRLQSARALSFYLEELHELGGELSLNSRNVGVSEALQALADRSPDRSTAPPGRTLPPRHLRHLRPPGGDGARARATRRCCATPWATPRPMPMPPSCGPSSTCSTARSRRTARPSWRAGACAACGARSTCSASIWPASICARTPRSTSARSASCSRPPARAPAMPSSPRRRASPSCWRSSRRHGRWPRPSWPIRRRRARSWRSSGPRRRRAGCTVRQR